jgi:hypothetical protein
LVAITPIDAAVRAIQHTATPRAVLIPELLVRLVFGILICIPSPASANPKEMNVGNRLRKMRLSASRPPSG